MLYRKIHKCYIEKFVGKTLNCAVLDSGCIENVCGKKGDVKIDFARDKVCFLNQNVDIVFFSSSHYAMSISRTEQLLDHYDKNNESERAVLTINELSSKSPKEKKKLQRNFTISLVTLVLKNYRNC